MSKEKVCDLHIHTTYSDGSQSVEQVMEYAKRRGIHILAITDHDTVAGVEEAMEYGKKAGIRVIPGMELSTKDVLTGRNLHMLCYLPEHMEILTEFANRTLAGRREQKRRMVEKLHRIYPLLDLKMVEEYARESKSIYECHIMQGLCDMGYTNTAIGSLMESLISSKGSCYVPSNYPTTEEAVRVIREAGGIAVVAHPEQFDSFDLVEKYAAEGLIQGVEVFHPRNSAAARERLKKAAQKYGLLITGGSDFHGQYAKHPNPLGSEGCTEEMVRALLNSKV